MSGGRKPETERQQRAEIARYLTHVYDQAGYTSQAELARDVRVEPSRVSHWLNATGGGRGPSAHNLLRVIQAAERRKAGASAVEIDPPLADRLAALEAKLDEGRSYMTESLDRLAGAIARLEAQLDGEDGRRRHPEGK